MRGLQAEVGASLISSSPVTRPALPARTTALVAALAPAVWAADQASKQWALGAFREGEAVPFLGRALQFTLVFNPGAAFSMGTGVTPLITGVMVLMAVAIVIAALRVRSRWWGVALGFLLGGALGNLTDRFLRPPAFAHGHVVDFLMFPHFPVFNVADSFITTAAVMVMIAALKDIPFDGRRGETGDEDAPRLGAAGEEARRG